MATGPEPFLWSHELRMRWWQLCFADVWAAAAATLAAAGAAVYWCLSSCLRQARRGSRTVGQRAKVA